MENWNPRHEVTQAHLSHKAQVKSLTAKFEKWITDHLPPPPPALPPEPSPLSDPDWIGFAADATTTPVAPVENGSVDFFRRLQKARNRRMNFFGGDLFADPAWDIMIDLYVAAAEHKQISVTSACVASCAPHTTALRHLAILTEAGVILRTADVRDGRRVFVRLSDEARNAMTRWYESSGFA